MTRSAAFSHRENNKPSKPQPASKQGRYAGQSFSTGKITRSQRSLAQLPNLPCKLFAVVAVVAFASALIGKTLRSTTGGSSVPLPNSFFLPFGTDSSHPSVIPYVRTSFDFFKPLPPEDKPLSLRRSVFSISDVPAFAFSFKYSQSLIASARRLTSPRLLVLPVANNLRPDTLKSSSNSATGSIRPLADNQRTLLGAAPP